MQRWLTKAVLLASGVGIAALGLALPALSAPEQLLPPGFGGDQPAQPARAPTPLLPASPGQTLDQVDAQAAPPQEGGLPLASADNLTVDDLLNDAGEDNQTVELPPAARRQIDEVGPFRAADSGFGEDAFAGSNGRYLSTLMRRLDAPIASRWLSITLRRALLTHVPTPPDVAPTDWVAERAWLLLRMGEADAARMLVELVDVDRFTPKMYTVAQQVALATADPAALCPLTGGAAQYSKEPAWDLARAMCAGLSGDGSTSSMLIDRAKEHNNGRNIDVLLAEKVVGVGTNTRRAVHIEWDGVDKLTTWRFGLASAVAVEVPPALLNSVGPHVQAWRARAPLLSPESRLPSARIAAALGVFSSASLVDLYSQIGDREGDARDTPSGRLRTAYVGDDDGARLTALRAIWDDAKEPRDRYSAQILTARAAARITPSSDWIGDSDRLIASMLSAGLDLQTMRWAPIVNDARASNTDTAWALLAVGTPRPAVDLSYGRVDDYANRAGTDGRHRAQLLVAALAGLGRLSGDDQARLNERYDIGLVSRSGFTQTIDAAASSGAAGTVALLAAVGMQTTTWEGVPPVFLYHIIGALRRTGQEAAARMIAAEAISRS